MKILPKSINFAKEGSKFYKTLKKPTKVCQKSHLAKFGEVSPIWPYLKKTGTIISKILGSI